MRQPICIDLEKETKEKHCLKILEKRNLCIIR